jgi:hypothetical protein
MYRASFTLYGTGCLVPMIMKRKELTEKEKGDLFNDSFSC